MNLANENKLLKWTLGGAFALILGLIAFAADGMNARQGRIELRQNTMEKQLAEVISILHILTTNPSMKLPGAASADQVDQHEKRLDRLESQRDKEQ